MGLWPDWETIPFHFVFISLTLVYGFRVWRTTATAIVLALVIVITGTSIFVDALNGSQLWGELFEVPLMSVMFLTMVWHARRREAALVQVAQLADRQGEFVRDASHQLKTPIAISRALATVIKTSNNERQRDEDIADLIEELDRLGQIAEELLMLAGSHSDGLVRAPVELEDLLVTAIARWSRRIDRTWRVHVLADGTIDADRTRLESALDAILENAAAATTDGNVIEAFARCQAGKATIEIVDYGRGIGPEGADRVFDRFWSSPYRPGGKRGTGLGLSIVKAIAEAHGGVAEFSSVVGVRTSVRLILPRLKVGAHAPEVAPLSTLRLHG
jgi:signal transduction histidine kinase